MKCQLQVMHNSLGSEDFSCKGIRGTVGETQGKIGGRRRKGRGIPLPLWNGEGKRRGGCSSTSFADPAMPETGFCRRPARMAPLSSLLPSPSSIDRYGWGQPHAFVRSAADGGAQQGRQWLIKPRTEHGHTSWTRGAGSSRRHRSVCWRPPERLNGRCCTGGLPSCRSCGLCQARCPETTFLLASACLPIAPGVESFG